MIDQPNIPQLNDFDSEEFQRSIHLVKEVGALCESRCNLQERTARDQREHANKQMVLQMQMEMDTLRELERERGYVSCKIEQCLLENEAIQERLEEAKAIYRGIFCFLNCVLSILAYI